MALPLQTSLTAQPQSDLGCSFRSVEHTTSSSAQRMQRASGIVIVRVPQVLAKTGMSRSRLYSLINPSSRYFDPTFPTKAVIGTGPHSRAVGWRLHEIEMWLEAQFDKSQRGQA